MNLSEIDDKYLELAYEEANVAFEEREVPIGCVFVKDNATLHAEMVAISRTLGANGNDPTIFEGSTLYVTIEPCIMCASAIAQIGVSRVVFGASNDRFGGCGSVLSLHDQNEFSAGHKHYEVTRHIQKERSIEILQRFYNRENEHAPENKKRKKGS
ncbi:uncharacterized protein [Blastocystis hominis]|uniref:CMP/dCMP-type deaminase domain-containing protein n=1 Tax=Blastocystis hominis TaxID=12968 RepID=D8LVJ2_BLAHO|nr:uncharacterized protein [Blastocystis hominis]CBK19831.2 unnamed protein product [Blastocystis hominis]|eukprot:XP_012893879.1 uncharacterized protein [Blastocystis hominis]